MLIPRVVGFKLAGELPEGSTATDLVLTITEMLRKHGVVGKFVEFYGPGVAAVPLANRATIGNMSPEYGSTCAIFPIDDETLRYLRFTGRKDEQVALVEAYAKEQGLWHDPSVEPAYSETLELDLSTVEPSLAGPKRPQDRVPLKSAKPMFREALELLRRRRLGPERRRRGDRRSPSRRPTRRPSARATRDAAGPSARRRGADGPHVATRSTVDFADGDEVVLDHGAVVIAAITSCTNTSNPSVMIGAALLAKKAVEKGLTRKPWVKTSLAPGSKVVTDYYDRAGLTPYLEKLGFNLVGYGCTTCIGNSGPLIAEVVDGGQRGRPRGRRGAVRQPQLRGPDQPRREDELPRVAAAGRRVRARRLDGRRPDQRPARARTATATTCSCTTSGRRRRRSQEIDRLGDRERDVQPATTPTSSPATSAGRACRRPTGDTFEWDADSTYVRKPPYFDGMDARAGAGRPTSAARACSPKLGDSVTTDHISPGRLDQDRLPRRQVPRRARRRAQGLQLLRLAPRQPRGDDPRHVRQHPAAQPARAGHRGRLHPRLHRRRRGQTSIYDAVGELRRRRARRW